MVVVVEEAVFISVVNTNEDPPNAHQAQEASGQQWIVARAERAIVVMVVEMMRASRESKRRVMGGAGRKCMR